MAFLGACESCDYTLYSDDDSADKALTERKCSSCGATISATYNFCGNCGEAVGDSCPECREGTISYYVSCLNCNYIRDEATAVVPSGFYGSFPTTRQQETLIIDSDIPIPDILGSITKRKERFESGAVQWSGGLLNPIAMPGSYTALTIILQNVMDGEVDATVRASVTRHPNFGGSKLDVQGTTVGMGPLEAGIVTVPVYVQPGAGLGEYRLKIDVSAKGRGKQTRLRQRESAPGDGNRAKDLTGTVLKNALGIGLAATVGIGFISIPRSEIGISLTVERVVPANQLKSVPPQATYDAIWTADDYSRLRLANRHVREQGAKLLEAMSYEALVASAQTVLAESRMASFATLYEGERLVLRHALANAALNLLNDPDIGTGMLIRVVEDDLRSHRSGALGGAQVFSAYLNQFLAFAAFDGLATWDDIAEIGRSGDERWTLASGLASDLEKLVPHPTDFWLSWGIAGLRALRGNASDQLDVAAIEEALVLRESESSDFNEIATVIRGFFPKLLPS